MRRFFLPIFIAFFVGFSFQAGASAPPKIQKKNRKKVLRRPSKKSLQIPLKQRSHFKRQRKRSHFKRQRKRSHFKRQRKRSHFKRQRKRSHFKRQRKRSRTRRIRRRKRYIPKKRLSWEKAKEEIRNIFKKWGIPYEVEPVRAQVGHYGLPERLGPFPIDIELAPRIRFWAMVFAKYPPDAMIVYEPKHFIILNHYQIQGAPLSPDDSPAERRAKSRRRFFSAAEISRRLRKVLWHLAALERKAERAARVKIWHLRQRCKGLAHWRLRYLCRKALKYRSERYDKKDWARHFASLEGEAKKIWENVQKEPFFQGHSWYRIFRLIRSSRLSWQSSYRAFYLKGFRIEQLYHAHIEKILKAANLPRYLAALPFVESMYNPWVRSSVGALGLWQIMPNTAKENALYVANRYDRRLPPFDERLDPIFSTYAATRFIHLCRHFFPNSWPLAISSYNQGPGRMLRYARRAGGRNLSRIIRRLGSRFGVDGRNFYAKFMASVHVLKNQEKFFSSLKGKTPFSFKVIRLSRPIWFDELRSLSDMTLEELELYNPILYAQRWISIYPIPAHFPLRFPVNRYEKILQRLKSASQKRKVSIKLHEVLRRETLSHIARRYRIPLKVLLRANPLSSFSPEHRKILERRFCRRSHRKNQRKRREKATEICQLSAYRRLPKGLFVKIPAWNRAPRTFEIRSYKVKGIEPLSFIACRFCTTVWHLRQLNPALKIRRLRRGMLLKVPSCSRMRKRHFRDCWLHHFRYRRRRWRHRRRRRGRKRRKFRRRKRRRKAFRRRWKRKRKRSNRS